MQEIHSLGPAFVRFVFLRLLAKKERNIKVDKEENLTSKTRKLRNYIKHLLCKIFLSILALPLCALSLAFPAKLIKHSVVIEVNAEVPIANCFFSFLQCFVSFFSFIFLLIKVVLFDILLTWRMLTF